MLVLGPSKKTVAMGLRAKLLLNKRITDLKSDLDSEA